MGSAPPTSISAPASVSRPPSTGAWKTQIAPAFSASPCSDTMKAWLSMMPVDGLSSAAVQASAGSMACASARLNSVRSGTPFAAARAWMEASRPASSSLVATISLVQREYGTPRSSQ